MAIRDRVFGRIDPLPGRAVAHRDLDHKFYDCHDQCPIDYWGWGDVHGHGGRDSYDYGNLYQHHNLECDRKADSEPITRRNV